MLVLSRARDEDVVIRDEITQGIQQCRDSP
jgi:sRNA-binding carbon storage regulator CsrA